MSDEEKKTRSTTGVKFSSFTEAQPEAGNPMEVVGLRDGNNVRATLTTDLIETNPNQFRDRKGRFAPAPEELAGLTNQRSVNEFLWKYTQEGSDVQDELKAAVSEGLSLQANIEQGLDLLADKVNALEGAVGEHSYIFGMSTAPDPGVFSIIGGDTSPSNTISGGVKIHLSATDRAGKPVDLDRVVVGDVLRMSDIGQETCELQITSVDEAPVFGYEKLTGTMDRLSEYPYDFILLSSFDPAGLATISYVDERDDTKYDKSGGRINGDVTINANSTTISGKEGTSSGQGIFSVRANGPSGKQVIEVRNSGTIKLKNSSGNTLMASAEDEPMTKKATQWGFNATHPLWKYMGVESDDLDATQLNKGEFALKFSGSGEGKTVYIYLSKDDANNHYWYGVYSGEYQHAIESMVSITNASGLPRLTAKGTLFKFNQGGHNFFRCTGEYVKENYTLTRGGYYNINLPGLLPQAVYSAHWNNSSNAGTFMLEDEDEPYVAPENEPNVMGTDPDEL